MPVRKFTTSLGIDSMRSSTLKGIILIFSLIIIIVLVFQVIWLTRVYTYEQKMFNGNVVKCIRQIYEEIPLTTDARHRLNSLIERPDPHTFLFKVDSLPEMDELFPILERELSMNNIQASCEVAFYDPEKKEFTEHKITDITVPHFVGAEKKLTTTYKRNHPYVSLNFPYRNRYILGEMRFWIITTSILFVFIIILASSLVYLYRQKFLNELQKDFVNNISHEFKTPLAVMKIASEVLRNGQIASQPEKLNKYSSIIQEQTDHLENQVDKLLRSSYSKEFLLKPELKPVVINDTIKHTLHILEPLIISRQASIELFLEPGNQAISADPVEIQMVLVNLIENALKYSENPLITLRTSIEKQYYVISCADNGPGIEKKYTPRIFDKFYRVPTGNVHNVKGFGLGLNFVKTVVSKHRGRIKVKSVPGEGSNFILYLPL